MTQDQKDRLVEVRFYLLVKRLYAFHPNVDNLLTFFDSITMFKQFDSTVIQAAAMRILTDHFYKPPLKEMAILLWADGESLKSINKLTRLNNRRIHSMVNAFKADPYVMKSNFQEDQLKEFTKFLDVFKELCTIGGM